MDRIQAVEIHDLPECPEFIRESVTESLGNALRWGNLYSGGAADVFSEFCEKAKCDSLLDLCSGSGEPISILLEGLVGKGLKTPHVILSDLYPNITRMQSVVAKHSDSIRINPTPIDATQVPSNIDHSARSIISAFHHFPPMLAQDILRDCVTQGKAIFILEPMPHQVHGTLSIATSMVGATLANPILSKKNRLKKALFTYAIPAIPMVNTWDSIVSLLRVYREENLMAMVEPFGQAYHWEFHEIPVQWGGKVTAFTGYPA